MQKNVRALVSSRLITRETRYLYLVDCSDHQRGGVVINLLAAINETAWSTVSLSQTLPDQMKRDALVLSGNKVV